MVNNVSIIICFYNAGNKLRETIEHIKKVSISKLNHVEILFINNNSNDDSCKIINELLQDFSTFSWEMYDEPLPGLNNARKLGIKNAKYETLLFCDDDNWLEENYLELGCRILEKDEKIAVLGGKGIPTSKVSFPAWFEKESVYYAVGAQAAKPGLVKGERNVVYGAGMFVRKQYYNKIIENGFEFFSSDRVGNNLSSGGDSEMCLALTIAGYKIWYDENLLFHHYIDENRLDLEYLNKLKRGISGSRFITRFYLDFINGYEPKVTRWFWLKELCYTLFDLGKCLVQMNKIGVIRNWSFSRYLLRERGVYNKNVIKIVSLCKQLMVNKSELF
jgi:glycosyltransferase involved in cell wall biosynthesis